MPHDVAMAKTADVEIRGPSVSGSEGILTPDAIEFLGRLHKEFEPRRRELLERRTEVQARLLAGELPAFPTETRKIRDSEWRVGSLPKDLERRRVEITGPTDRKMVINALNSGADVYMADFEDANTPSWANMIEGQLNLIDAVRRRIDFISPEGKRYRLNDEIATLLVRPRGWHLMERHFEVGGEPIAGGLFDFGLYVFHNAAELLRRGSGPYFYLPKLENRLEARLWNDVLSFAEDELRLERGTMKATVLVEVILAAFEMDEILYELREHSTGLNAGRWDYIFSLIKKFRNRSDFVLPDRIQVTMTVPFMRAYTELLVQTCHRRGAQAMGGMAAYIPSRKDVAVNEKALAKVREDKVREATDGFDGTWVAHPDLVPTAMAEFDRILGTKPNQLDKLRGDVRVDARDLVAIHVPGGTITEAGLRTNVSVGIAYLESWLRGTGAAAINNLMEDAATCEISRSQIWQWVHHDASLDGGARVTPELVRRIEREELDKIERLLGAAAFSRGKWDEARALFERVALADDFTEFLTLPAYERVD
jgi:malate synthase